MDGVRVNEVFGDVVNWDVLPMNGLAQIALVPGSNPVYGLNTLGGALVLTTRDGSAFPGTHAALTAGAFGRRAVAAQHGGAAGQVDWLLGDARQAYTWPDITRNRLTAITLRARHALSDDQEIIAQSYARRPRSSSLNSNVTVDRRSDDDEALAVNVNSITGSATHGVSLQWSGLMNLGVIRHAWAIGVAADIGSTDFDQHNTPAVISAGRERHPIACP